MYRKPRFLEVLHDIREEMSREADYDVELFAQIVRGRRRPHGASRVSAIVSDEPGRVAKPKTAREALRPKRTA